MSVRCDNHPSLPPPHARWSVERGPGEGAKQKRQSPWHSSPHERPAGLQEYVNIGKEDHPMNGGAK